MCFFFALNRLILNIFIFNNLIYIPENNRVSKIHMNRISVYFRFICLTVFFLHFLSLHNPFQGEISDFWKNCIFKTFQIEYNFSSAKWFLKNVTKFHTHILVFWCCSNFTKNYNVFQCWNYDKLSFLDRKDSCSIT